MPSLFARYTHWLHTRWPAGTVETLPECDEHGRTALAGVRIVGDLTGIPLLKFSSDSGARAVREIAAELEAEGRGSKVESQNDARAARQTQPLDSRPSTLDLQTVSFFP